MTTAQVAETSVNNATTNIHSLGRSYFATLETRWLVSKETVVLRQWGRETQNFGFISNGYVWAGPR